VNASDPLSGETITDRPSRILRPGMALTIEPGLYVRPSDGIPKEFWNIGIRIEDDAFVTADRLRTDHARGAAVPPKRRRVDEIEALMRPGPACSKTPCQCLPVISSATRTGRHSSHGYGACQDQGQIPSSDPCNESTAPRCPVEAPAPLTATSHRGT
jgi:hypothetical protein